MNQRPRYASLQDYLRVLRRHRLLIALITLAFIGGAFALSSAQTPTYSSAASLSFRDPAQDAQLIGTNLNAVQAPGERSAQNAQLVTSPRVVDGVQKDLKSDLTDAQMTAKVSAQVDIRTNLLDITAEDSDAKFAARLANTFAEQTAKVITQDREAQLDIAQDSLKDQIEGIQGEKTSAIKSIQLSVLQTQASNLTTLSSVANPAQIETRASVPDEPVSPRPARNTVIGGVIGLVLGLLAAFLRDSLDRRLHNATEVHAEMGMPILGRVGDTALGYPGLATNGRPPMSEIDFEGFRMLRMNLGFLSKGTPVKTVLVTSSLPEEGKSTVSMSLASAAALAGQRVLLVECDLRRPAFPRRLGINRTPGLSDYLLGQASPQEIMQTVSLTEPGAWTPSGDGPIAEDRTAPEPQLVCIAAGSPVQTPAELLVSDRFKAFMSKVSKAYDLVVLDSSPLLAVVDPLELVPQVDGVLVCVRVQRTTREQARATRASLATLPERPTGAVVTGLKRGDPDSYDYYYGY